MQLTPEQFRIAESLGCRFQPAAAEQIARLSMQRRVFWLDDQAYLAQRGDGFYETAATLSHLLQEAEGRRPREAAAAVEPPAALQDAAPIGQVAPRAEAAASEATASEAMPLEPAAPAVELPAAAAGQGRAARAAPRRRKAAAPPPATPEPEAEPEPELEAEAEAALAGPPGGEPLEEPAGDPPHRAAEPPPAAAPRPHAIPRSARAETARLVAAYVASTPITATELPALIRGIHQSVLTLSRR